MSRYGEGAWLQTAARYADGLPEGKQRRAALRRRCERDQVDEGLISRMISARTYALRWIEEDHIKASHKTVEILRGLENINALKAASIRRDVLKGIIGRPELTNIVEDEKSSAQARKVESVSMTLSQVILQVSESVSFIDFDRVDKNTDEKLSIFGANIQYTKTDFNDETYAVTDKPIWALVISPHISCSAIFGSGVRGFILSIASLCWIYPKISVLFSSQRERDEILKLMSHHAKAILETKKLIFHVAEPVKDS